MNSSRLFSGFSPCSDTSLAPIFQSDPSYPPRLRGLSAPPKSLWVVGRLPGPAERVVAMVGARAATGAGCERARTLAADLGRNQITIVSGGAFGIDAAAHIGALEAGAPTFAVLGCGVDIAYPDRHAGLFAEVAKGGGLLSEYPPGTKPRRGQFPARNRIIAGLAEAVIVVEAAHRSGALITAAFARKLGRPLLAVPGSSGTDALLRTGHAIPVTSVEETLRALAGELGPSPSEPAIAGQGTLAMVLHAIATGASTPSLLCKRAGLSLPTLLAILAEAELDGLVKRAGGDTYEVIGRAC
jgi:DNA processing protein